MFSTVFRADKERTLERQIKNIYQVVIRRRIELFAGTLYLSLPPLRHLKSPDNSKISNH